MSELAVIDRRGDQCVPQAVTELDRAHAAAAIGLTVYDNLDTIATEWRRFEQEADGTAFQAFDWMAIWCQEVGWRSQTRPAIVVGRRDDGETLFILPLAVTPGIVSRLTFLGSELCDYNGPLLAKDFASHVEPAQFPALWRDILKLLKAHYRYDLVQLTKLLATVGSQANPFLTLAVNRNPSNAYAANLFGTWNEFYEAKRSAATRRRDRTKLKRLAEFGEVAFVSPQGRDDTEHTMGVLMAQKARSFARMGVPNIFARPGWSEFYTAIASNPRTQHLVHVSRLDAGPTYTAINLGLVFQDSYYHVLASHDDGETSRFGPGVAHLRELLRYAIERGLKRFDFTIGDERYKSEWADGALSLYDHTAAASVRAWPAVATVAAHRRLKRLIKQNEALWSLFSRARAAFGSKPAAGGGAQQSGEKSPPIAPD